ncbi:retrotransposon protein, putative, ty1-copia subclass [Tanacetum coccineum]
MQASRSIYGLKQASRSWNKRFDEEIKRFGFDQNLDEPCVYQKASGSNVTFLILYVDDIIIMGNHIPSLQSVKDYLGKCFAMKDLGEAAFILGIKIYRDRSKRLIGLGQNAYMDKILKRYKMDNSKRGHIPMQERLDLNKTQGASTPKEVKRMQNIPYASAVGSIMYVVRCTRPDVAFAQNITSRFQQNPVTLLIANEPGVQMGARHYHRRYLLKVHTDDNLAYPFTKALPKGKLTQHARSMGLHRKTQQSGHSSDKNPDCNKSETNESYKEENHVKQDSSVSTTVAEPQISTDVPSWVINLIDELKSLKGSQLKQIVKINMLEKRLVESKQEVQQLKNRICSLEHGSQHVVDPVEVDDHESIKSQSNFDESVYIVGGFDGSLWSSSLESYSPFKDKKSSLS